MEFNIISTKKIKLKNKLLPIILIPLAIEQAFFPHKVWVILLIGFGGVLGLSLIWALSLRKGLKLARQMRYGSAQVGDVLQEYFMLANESRFSALFTTMIDHSDFPGYQINTARYVEARATKRWMKGGVCNRRGYYTYGPTELESGDPFGIFSVTLHFPETRKMLVVPPVIPLPSIEIASGDRIGEGGVRAYSPERTITAATVRDYVTGDDLHAIHWLTSARRDDLYVRVFDQTPTSEWWLFLDMDEAVQIGEGQEATEEYAVVLAASIAERGLRNDRAVGLVAHGKERVWLPPHTGNDQRWDILKTLATIDKGKEPLSALIAKTQPALGRNTSVIIITASTDQDWLGAVNKLQRRNIAVTVLLLDRAEFGGDGNANTALAKLAAWGITHHRITPNIYETPSVPDYFVMSKTSHGRSSSTFTASDLDWGKFS